MGIGVETRVNIFQNKVDMSVLVKSAFEADLADIGKTLPSRVNLVEVSGFSRPANGNGDDTMWGGLTLHRTDTSQSCTSGFTVEHSNGTQGVTTADHCEYPMSYDGQTLPRRRGEEDGGSIDPQWFLAPNHDI